MELLTIEEVSRRLTVSVQTVRRLIREGKFPEPIHPTEGAVAWTADDVTAYLWSRMNSHRLRKPGAKGKTDDDEDSF
jgi:predicted DNA-binding transcriptional regulator AlpA